MSTLVTSHAKINEVGKEIQMHEIVTGTKINYNKSVGLWFGSWTVCPLLGSYSQMSSSIRSPTEEKWTENIGKDPNRI